VNRKLRDIVASKLILDWSPEQISGWLKNRYANDESMRVSHETIYRSLFVQARGVLKKELMDHLRSKRRMRRSRHSSEHGQSRGQIVDATSIRERPAEAEDRAIPGHWEGDLPRGTDLSAISKHHHKHLRSCKNYFTLFSETVAVLLSLTLLSSRVPAISSPVAFRSYLNFHSPVVISNISRLPSTLPFSIGYCSPVFGPPLPASVFPFCLNINSCGTPWSPPFTLNSPDHLPEKSWAIAFTASRRMIAIIFFMKHLVLSLIDYQVAGFGSGVATAATR
jgi:hypothetical protein